MSIKTKFNDILATRQWVVDYSTNAISGISNYVDNIQAEVDGKADITYVNDRVKTPVPDDAVFTDTIVDISGKADKVLPYTPLTGANVTVSPSNSYTWKTTTGANLLTATGFTAGVDASCSMVITMFEGDTVAASGLSFEDELEVGVNHCFIRQMPTGKPKLFVSYVGVYGDIFVDGSAPAGGDGTSWRTPYKQIQDAIDGATPGDLILVKPGTYTPIDSGDKEITIESTGGAEVTTIDGNNTTRCARLVNATLNGFTLTSGLAQYTGVTDEDERGGGSYGGTLNNCILTGNKASSDGGGSYDSTLNNCTLSNNSADYGGGSAGGTLNNCTLSGNTAGTNGGGSSYDTLNNCIVWGNTVDPYMGEEGTENYSDSTLNYCNSDPLPAGTGNISQDPKFVSGSNLRLQSTSPCINAGSNDSVVGDKDLDGNPRIFGGTVDMGAYEFQGE